MNAKSLFMKFLVTSVEEPDIIVLEIQEHEMARGHLV